MQLTCAERLVQSARGLGSACRRSVRCQVASPVHHHTAHVQHTHAARDDDTLQPIHASSPKIVDISSILSDMRGQDVFVWTEEDEEEHVAWEHEDRFLLSTPLHAEDIGSVAAEEAHAAPDPLSPLHLDVTSAYSPEQGFAEMSTAELAAALERGEVALLLDVRTRAEFAAGHITGATNAPLDELSSAARNGQLDAYRDAQITVVCASGQRSAQAVVRLTKVLGFARAVNVAGGMQAWGSEAREVVRGGGCGGSGGSGCGCRG